LPLKSKYVRLFDIQIYRRRGIEDYIEQTANSTLGDKNNRKYEYI